MPAPCVIEGGGGLSTICGFCFEKREKKLAHISIPFFTVNPYKFLFFSLRYETVSKKTEYEERVHVFLVHHCAKKTMKIQHSFQVE
jgi:hypothetical protein